MRPWGSCSLLLLLHIIFCLHIVHGVGGWLRSIRSSVRFESGMISVGWCMEYSVLVGDTILKAMEPWGSWVGQVKVCIRGRILRSSSPLVLASPFITVWRISPTYLATMTVSHGIWFFSRGRIRIALKQRVKANWLPSTLWWENFKRNYNRLILASGESRPPSAAELLFIRSHHLWHENMGRGQSSPAIMPGESTVEAFIPSCRASIHFSWHLCLLVDKNIPEKFGVAKHHSHRGCSAPEEDTEQAPSLW